MYSPQRLGGYERSLEGEEAIGPGRSGLSGRLGLQVGGARLAPPAAEEHSQDGSEEKSEGTSDKCYSHYQIPFLHHHLQ
ncbi:unnamed protein product [Nezara viridula]|uniref:Uncharacterized protein n=1 Tax=Nezara viridula TaxID=85310 RepID=A0A9P0HTG2_NEZVI|nr:unnamed protein product [Nezara viridula]